MSEERSLVVVGSSKVPCLLQRPVAPRIPCLPYQLSVSVQALNALQISVSCQIGNKEVVTDFARSARDSGTVVDAGLRRVCSS